jgi:hypothetical protein
MMRWLVRIAAGLVLALGLVLPAFAAQPDGRTPQTAFPLSGTAAGSLIGTTGGTFTYYTFNYPGDGSQGSLALTFSPGDQATANGIGVTLWQAGSQFKSISGVSNVPGANSTTFSSTTPGPILAQVYNYNPGVAVSYQLALAGVSQTAPAPAASGPAPAVAAPTPTPVPAAGGDGSANSPFPLSAPASGILPGSKYGSFVNYTFNYPGDGSQQSATLDFSPRGNEVGNAVFLTLYQNGVQLAQGQGSASQTLGHIVVNFSSTTSGPILAQVSNYNMDATISYTVSH